MIRPVTAADAAAICAIYNPYVTDTVISFEEAPVSAAVMKGRIGAIAAVYPWIVYEEGGAVSGYACLHRWHERRAYRFAAEDTIYLRPDCCGRGIGSALLQRLIEEARRMELHVIMSAITVPNDASVGLHEKFGFTQAGCFSGIGYKAGRRLDVGYWELILDAAPGAHAAAAPTGG
jgi:phosphinothricin acetyltransferase